ncbi:MAG TPA: peroxide stress protein YaaA [Burkholderiaceae bacterium]|nr:peroxide stress protein YaaA [Burkholderiaceae bacterium]
MLLLLSPAKKLDYDSPVRTALHTQPLFVDQAAALIKTLKKKKAADVAALMKLSDALAELNVRRYADWKPSFDPSTARQAALAFNGDVYGGLDAPSLSDAQLRWAQEHIAILSGLYGVLRPLDLMRPYRLEMGTALATTRGKNLYDYWGSSIAGYLNTRLADQAHPLVLNLASDEYFKSVDLKALKARVIQCVFQNFKSDAWKVISFNAKRARGLMARFVIDHKIADPKRLRGFDAEGYAFAESVSTPDKLVFRRAESTR